MDTMDCTGEAKSLERTRYFTRQLITAGDLNNEQNYQREKRRMHNRLLHGWGIVCGLNVIQKANTKIVTICSGYALSPQGDEIFLPVDIEFDLDKMAKGQASPCSPCGSSSVVAVDTTKPYYIAIKFAECMSSPVRVSPVGCGCDDTACEYSRIRDGFEITCLQVLPVTHPIEEPAIDCDAVNNKIIPCPPCPSDPWIVLAQIPPKSGAQIEFTDRHILLPTAMMVDKCVNRE